MNNQIKIITEDSIMQKGKTITAGSKILKGFKSPFDATVIEKLIKTGINIEKTVPIDEFGIDNLFSDSEEPLAAIKEATADKSACVLCNDIFGKIKRQAAGNSLFYLQPTYGTVSRYGLIPTASSMDQIGIACTDFLNGFETLKIIAGKDERDGAMLPDKHYRYEDHPAEIKITFPENVWDKNDEYIISSLSSNFEIKKTNLKYFEIYPQVLYILSSAEICNNTNRYDGVKFGYRNENSKNLNDLYLNTRSEGFTLNTKLAVIMGANVLIKDNYEPYYEKAMKIRRLIKEAVNFDGYDVIALPAKNDKPKYEQSALYALTALAGLPSLTIPFGGSGIQFITAPKCENKLKKIAATLHTSLHA